MTWVVEDCLAKTLRGIEPCPGMNVSLDLYTGAEDEEDSLISVMVFWHMPSLNLGWYPIGEIAYRGQTVYHCEGAENHDHWVDLFADMARFIESKKFCSLKSRNSERRMG